MYSYTLRAHLAQDAKTDADYTRMEWHFSLFY